MLCISIKTFYVTINLKFEFILTGSFAKKNKRKPTLKKNILHALTYHSLTNLLPQKIENWIVSKRGRRFEINN